MKRIIIFRHGEYDGSGELDADGAKAVFARAKLIRRETGRAATVFTSPVLRCRQTARVIALAMDGAETENEELLAENFSDRAHECKKQTDCPGRKAGRRHDRSRFARTQRQADV